MSRNLRSFYHRNGKKVGKMVESSSLSVIRWNIQTQAKKISLWVETAKVHVSNNQHYHRNHNTDAVGIWDIIKTKVSVLFRNSLKGGGLRSREWTSEACCVAELNIKSIFVYLFRRQPSLTPAGWESLNNTLFSLPVSRQLPEKSHY